MERCKLKTSPCCGAYSWRRAACGPSDRTAASCTPRCSRSQHASLEKKEINLLHRDTWVTLRPSVHRSQRKLIHVVNNFENWFGDMLHEKKLERQTVCSCPRWSSVCMPCLEFAHVMRCLLPSPPNKALGFGAKQPQQRTKKHCSWEGR